MSFETHSESVFAHICARHHYVATKLATRSSVERKTADFLVTTPGEKFIAEIEELQPNRDDLRQIREMKEKNWTHGGGVIGSRARSAIRHAALQLRSHKEEGVPLIVVLYNNIKTTDGRAGHPLSHLEGYHIDAAMFGQRVVNVPLVPNVAPKPDRSGGGRTMTPQWKTYISAVAVISDWDDETIIVYHNCFAQRPFPTALFTDGKSVHFEKRGEPYTEPWIWHKLMHDQSKGP
jgi:hypothetical protein